MKYNPKYPLKHISIRVPWHDNKWNGTVCRNPKANGACLILKNCALNRNDALEEKHKGKSIDDLSENEYPTCVGERGTFMAPFSFKKEVKHPYVKTSPESHGHLRPVDQRYPAYSANCVPFNWMIKGNAEARSDLYDLGFDDGKEPELSFKDNWIQQYDNQKAMLNAFFQHFEVKTSLVFFYAKQVPFYEGSGRVLIGVGKLEEIIESMEYVQSDKSKLRSTAWEHMVRHSIRPGFKDGFLLPYHEAIEYGEDHPDFDPSELTVITPSNKMFEFSYGSEHVSNDSAISTLLRCKNSIELAKEKGIGEHHNRILQWIHDEILRIEKLRGYYPGMGAALCAFGISKGHFVASEIVNNMDEGANPWDLFQKAIENPEGIISSEVSDLIPGMVKRTYARLVEKKSERLDLLHLLSRFEISQEQAKVLYVNEEREAANIPFSDKEIIENPYLLFEATVRTIDPIDFDTIDMGLQLPKEKEGLLPISVSINDPLDERRIRALTVKQLELAGLEGHTLLPRTQIIQQIRELPIKPKCEVNSDHFETAEESFTGGIERAEMKDGKPAYQLTLQAKLSGIIRTKVSKRKNAARLDAPMDWLTLINQELFKHTDGEPDSTELKAREEKAAALKELAESRISVLIGSAGTGKTTLLSILTKQDDIKKGGVVFLAPTGKARVRLEEVTRELQLPVYTLASFLRNRGRYDGKTQTYRLSNQRVSDYETIIVDEASMLTEAMLATLMDSFRGVKRFILVGDYRQLPPIGAGRPFVDIIHFLKPDNIESAFPKVGSGYAELTVSRRQGGSNRSDVQLASFFGGNRLEPGEDAIINDIIHSNDSQHLRLIRWDNEKDFEEKFRKTLVEELELDDIFDKAKFNNSLGSDNGDHFNWKYAVLKVEAWQILSPIREKVFGVKSLNRTIHKLFRSDVVKESYEGFKKVYGDKEFNYHNFPKPLGQEEIVYGDKVINLGNHQRNNIYPKEGGLNYIANGEIGLVVGQRKTKKFSFKGKPKKIEVEFSSQKGFKYDFYNSDFNEERGNALELAYAITVHKSQGSEFGTVFLVIPNPCFLLKREMLYTALTRQKERVVVLYQGDIMDIKKLTSDLYSDTLSRITNLFEKPEMVEVQGKYLEKYLIHQASDGELLRSKSELLIYQRLLDKDLIPVYEKNLTLKEVTKIPDFTIEDEDAGTAFYWEHCGMMHDAEYVSRWEEKQKWYRENDILPIEEGGGSNGTLIVSEDTPILIDGETRGAISIKEIDSLIENAFGI